jgi:hypothetical protein
MTSSMDTVCRILERQELCCLSYSGFYCTLDFEQNAELRIFVHLLLKPQREKPRREICGSQFGIKI